MQGSPLKLSADEHSGRSLGKYEVLCRLSMGGMSEIFLAFSRGLAGFRKLVVLKQILPDIKEEEEFVRMFLDEAKITAAFNHPNIAHVYDLDIQQGELFLAMEFVPGATLVEVARACRQNKEPIPVGFTLSAVRDTALALHYAHTFTDPAGNQQTVIHRDIAEKNIMVTYEGVTKLLDFGIAKNLLWRSRTQVGMVKGTSGYMSPEQIMGEPLDARSDIFSLGVVLHECLTGMRLFHGKTPEQGMSATLKSEPPVPSALNPEVTPALDAVTRKALAKKREERFGTALEFARELERAAVGMSWHPEQSAIFMQRLFATRREQTRALLANIQDEEVTGARNIVALLGEQPPPVRSVPSRGATPPAPPPAPPPATPPPLPEAPRARPELVRAEEEQATPPPPPRAEDIPTNPGRRLPTADASAPPVDEDILPGDFLLDDEDGLTIAESDLEKLLQQAGLRRTDEGITTDSSVRAYVPEPMTQLSNPDRLTPDSEKPRQTDPDFLSHPVTVTTTTTEARRPTRAGWILAAVGVGAVVVSFGVARWMASNGARSAPSLPPATLVGSSASGEAVKAPEPQAPVGPPAAPSPAPTLTPPSPPSAAEPSGPSKQAPSRAPSEPAKASPPSTPSQPASSPVPAAPTPAPAQPAPTPSPTGAPAATAPAPASTSSPTTTTPATASAKPTAAALGVKLPGRLNLVTRPSSATVLLKSQRLGTTPLHGVALPAGSHSLRVVGEDGVARTLVVDVAPGEQTFLDVQLDLLKAE